ncbi:monofunctional biosynthetic peptidoglycan transglycosylase [Halopseudomonas xinjiangensis]|uniref:Biosynthetic peptidoglycan transglycosylase n=1 Tax=Halopseudomonas xinjiangensis TaxID=487184 RepID=A0A1H1X8C8_9GAMM|nr:monofunctional biosynthetic peptidoglycan transglycosylase [Halopseudomonas xinjiangensis]SDT05567.1 monofunctional biosynthetic peptidoglycan transglycosylase [Halopseudomonas xinjiangensis]
MIKRILAKAAKWLLIVMALSLVPVIILRWVPTPGSMLMIERWAEARGNGGLDIRHDWIAYDRIPDNMKMAVIAAEDQRFAEHFGFDLKAIRAAIEHNRQGGSVRGASTLTQQVAKNQFLWSGRSWLRKGVEAWFTLWIEILWPKQRILELYLNLAEWDEGVFGVEAAARHHFGVSASVLSNRQAAQLAAVLPSPLRWSASRPPAHVQQRVNWIQRQSRQLGGRHYLDQMESGRELPDWMSVAYWRDRI